MIEDKFLMRAIDIARVFGLHDRTITRWHLKGLIKKHGRGKYCLISVFKYYREQLKVKINETQSKIDNSQSDENKKSLELQKLESSLNLLKTNTLIKEFELEQLEKNLVNSSDAMAAYHQACQSIKNRALEMIENLITDVSNFDDPNQINTFLSSHIESLLVLLAN